MDGEKTEPTNIDTEAESNPIAEDNTHLNDDDEKPQEPEVEEASEVKGSQENASSPAENTLTDEQGADQVVEEGETSEAMGEELTADDPPAETTGRETAVSEAEETVVAEDVTVGADLPTSETFEDGEGPEIKPLIGEPLSREGSVKDGGEEQGEVGEEEEGLAKLDPGTPERESCSPAPEAPEEPEEGPGSGIDYEEHLDLLSTLQAENGKLSTLDGQLQAKLAAYFRRKTGEDAAERPERDKAVSDQEQRYQTYTDTMGDLRRRQRRDAEAHQQQAEELRRLSQDRLGLVEHEWSAFVALKREVAVNTLSRRHGKQAAQVEVEQLLASEQRREGELVSTRLKNVKLKKCVRRLQGALRAREELAEGLHLIDFEQLKIENQTYNEKIEERNEELLKLRKKITSMVQVLTHVKEKLQFVQGENQAKRGQLAEVEALAAHRRDVLTRTKQARDGLRTDNLRLRSRCGLLGNETLLRDFEEKVDDSEGLEGRLDALQRRHAELVLRCAGVKTKLERTKPASS